MQRDVLFIHGWWAADWVWSEMVDLFEAAGFRTHTLTLPGPERNQSTFADNLHYALEVARSIGNPVLVGHSAGGLLAMKMNETMQPPACIAITPAAPMGVLPHPSTLLIRFFVAAVPSLVFGRDFFPSVQLRQIALNRLNPAQQDDALKRMRPVSASQVRRIVPSLIAVDRHCMRSPLLVVGGSEDRLTPAAQTEAIARRYGADYREYRNAGHYILLEPLCAEMAADLIEWLNEKLRGGQASSDQIG